MTDPEARLTSPAYEFLAELVHARSRIRLGPDKRALVAGRLCQRLQRLGCPSYDAYCDLLRSPEGAGEIEALIDLIATNHTQFFREPAHFETLRRDVLPELGRRAMAAGRPLRLWCAAASSGEEAYSLAIVLAEHGRTHPGLEWGVLASDISRRMLDRCRAGIYEADKVQLPEAGLLARYFRQGFGQRQGYCRVKPELRRRVTVAHVNLFQDSYPLSGPQDVIFCRNVMIYFDNEARQTLVERLYGQLVPGGRLFVGHAESLLGLRHRFRQDRPGVYERPA